MEPVKDITYNVYTITNIQDPTNIYVGITKNFKNRIYNHRSNTTNENNIKYNQSLYKYIRECGGFNNFECKLVDTITCTKEQIHNLEKEYINKLKATLNLNINTNKKLERKQWIKNNSTTDYYNSRKEHFKIYHKEYRLRKRDEMLAYYRNYRALHKPIKLN